jgi:hypothetical protein
MVTMRRIHLILAASLILTTISCSKKTDYPRTYTLYEFSSGEVKMFTKTGEVYNNQEINKFTERVRGYYLNSPNPPDYVYSFDDDKDIMEDYDIEITFSSINGGTISVISPDNQTINFSLAEREGFCVISMQDTIEAYNYTENPRYECSPEIVERITIPMAGELVRYLKPLYIMKNNDEILICIVSYMERSYYPDNQFRSQSISGPANNMINNDYLLFIQNPSYNLTDTLAVKESYMVFK